MTARRGYGAAASAEALLAAGTLVSLFVDSLLAGSLFAGVLGERPASALMTDRATAAAEARSGGRAIRRGRRFRRLGVFDRSGSRSAVCFEPPEAFEDAADLPAPGAFAARATRWTAPAACAASTFFRACFAAFLVSFDALRAFFS